MQTILINVIARNKVTKQSHSKSLAFKRLPRYARNDSDSRDVCPYDTSVSIVRRHGLGPAVRSDIIL